MIRKPPDIRPDRDQPPDRSPETHLAVRDLRVHFPTGDGLVKAVDGLSFTVARGQIVGIVGESGSGKSVTSQTILGLHKSSRARITGEVWLAGTELVAASEADVRALRGSSMSMIFQDSLSSLHPFYTVGRQISEAYRVHNDVSRAAARRRSVEMLDRVGIPDPAARVDDYPHQFSGGMRQRAMIAMALVCNPQLLIADEPTTSLDVTVQAQILELMKDLQREFDSTIVLITHDLGVVAGMAHRTLVMYAGRAVEVGPTDTVFYRPRMPYTAGLLGSVPTVGEGRLRPIVGAPPSLINLPTGCPFSPRCPLADDICHQVEPGLDETDEPGHRAACHHQDELVGLADPSAMFRHEGDR
jgi:peptide/nickel transport system ATP-binding protein